jgi:hypothetical protein
MPKDLTIVLEDRPGELAKLGEALGRAAVNIDGICGMTVAGKGVIHILVEDATKARRALEVGRLTVEKETEVLVLPVEDRPGVLGNISRRLANAGVSIQLAYMATSRSLVIGVNDLEKARAAVEPKKTA